MFSATKFLSRQQPAYFRLSDGFISDFTLRLDQPAKIEEARRIIRERPEIGGHVTGIIVKEKICWNPNYSYYFRPDSVDFFEFSMEVCDATFQYTEENLDEAGGAFLPGLRLCPWGSYLVEEVTPSCPNQTWSENTQGQLSQNPELPTPLTLLSGVNSIRSSIGGGLTNDYFTFTVASGSRIDSIRLAKYVSTDSVSWIGLQSGQSWTAGNNPELMINQQHFGSSNLNSGLLAQNPLGPGSYTIRAQQLGAKTDYRLELSVSQS